VSRFARVFWIAALLVAGEARSATEVSWRGLLELGLVSSEDARTLNRLTPGDSDFDPYRVHLFLDARVSPTLELHLQTVLHEGRSAIRADGAYALYTPWPGHDLSLEAGKIPWPIGAYGPRAYPDRNVLIGTPLLYHYRTGLPWAEVVPNVDALVAEAGRAPFLTTEPYLPLVDERWWDSGAAVLGAFPPFEFSVGTVMGSLSWPSPGPDNTPGQTVLGRVGLVPVPGVRLGISGGHGSWMPGFLSFAMPAGRDARDYPERTLMADAEFARGAVELRAEGIRRRWATVHTGDLAVDAGYVEGRWALPAGTWFAARAEAMRFSDVVTSANVTRPWDDDVDRLELVVGYRLTRDARGKLGVQRTRRRPPTGSPVDHDLLAVSLTLAF
jgi:hypothetical protein